MRISPGYTPNLPGRNTTPASDSLLPEGRVLEELKKNFDRWDRDGNGQLSWSEVRHGVADPNIKGEEAVALATLYTLLEQDSVSRGLERKSPVPLDRLWDLYHDYTDEEDRPIADSLYVKYSAKLGHAASELFPQGLPNAHRAKQGTGPSCGFLAPTFAQALNDPNRVKNAISELEDGSFQVQFPGLSKPITVSPLTDTEKALFATAEDNGAWIGVLEKAWGTHQSQRNPLAAFEMSTYPEEAISAWTAGPATTTQIPKNPKGYRKGELPAFLRTTQRELAANGIAVAWTRFEGLTEENLVPGHAYTLMGVNQQTGTVTLRNPWGRLEPADSEGKPLDGTDDGLFEYPLEKFTVNFGQIARQKS